MCLTDRAFYVSFIHISNLLKAMCLHSSILLRSSSCFHLLSPQTLVSPMVVHSKSQLRSPSTQLKGLQNTRGGSCLKYRKAVDLQYLNAVTHVNDSVSAHGSLTQLMHSPYHKSFIHAPLLPVIQRGWCKCTWLAHAAYALVPSYILSVRA